MNPRIFISIGLSLALHILILGLLKLQGADNIASQSHHDDYLNVSIEQFDSLQDINKINSESVMRHGEETSANNSIAQQAKQENQPTDSLPILPPELHYYRIKDLEVKPEMIGEINTRPSQLATYKQGGEIKIQIWIDEQGNIVRTELLNSNLPQAFIDYTIASFNQSKFTAGIKDGMPVRSVAKVVVQYGATE